MTSGSAHCWPTITVSSIITFLLLLSAAQDFNIFLVMAEMMLASQAIIYAINNLKKERKITITTSFLVPY